MTPCIEPVSLRRLYTFAVHSLPRLYATLDYFCRSRAKPLSRRYPMSDIIIVVLGTGGILLMAAYAALCERI